MKEFKIDKKIENQVETMILLAKQFSDLKKQYPECFKFIIRQFDLGDYIFIKHIQDDIENIKVSLYAGIVRQNNKNRAIKEQQIKDKLVSNKI